MHKRPSRKQLAKLRRAERQRMSEVADRALVAEGRRFESAFAAFLACDGDGLVERLDLTCRAQAMREAGELATYLACHAQSRR